MCSKTTTQQNRVDPETAARQREVWGLASNRARQPFVPYTGERVAGLTPDQLAATDMVRSGAGSEASTFRSAADAMRGLATYQPGAVTPAGAVDAAMVDPTAAGGAISAPSVMSRDAVAKMFTDFDLAKYLNPATQNVVDTSLADLERSRLIARNADNLLAAGQGAFGGSRHAVLESLTNEAAGRTAAATAAQLRGDAFDRATGLITSDANRAASVDTANADRALAAAQTNAGNTLTAGVANRDAILRVLEGNANRGLAAGQFNVSEANRVAQGNQAADISGAGVRMGAAQGLASVGEMAQRARLGDAQALAEVGALAQGVQQGRFDAQYEDFLRRQGWQDAQIQQLAQILSSFTPGSNTKTQTPISPTVGIPGVGSVGF